MNAHEPHLKVWKFTNNSWTWLCWDCSESNSYGDEFPTHAEALAAALAHCAKAGKR